MSAHTPEMPRRAVVRSRQRAPQWMLVVTALLAAATLGTSTLSVAAYMRLQRYVESDPRLQYLRATVQESPDDLALRLQLASVYQQTGGYELALREYRRVLERDPANLAAFHNTGLISLAQGDLKGAERAFRDVLAIEPTHAYSASALGYLLVEAGRTQEIDEVVRPAVLAQPNLADLQYLMGVASEAAGARDEALAHYTRALELLPGMTEAQDAVDRLEAQGG